MRREDRPAPDPALPDPLERARLFVVLGTVLLNVVAWMWQWTMAGQRW